MDGVNFALVGANEHGRLTIGTHIARGDTGLQVNGDDRVSQSNIGHLVLLNRAFCEQGNQQWIDSHAMLHPEKMGQLDTISTSCQALSHAKWDILDFFAAQPSAGHTVEIALDGKTLRGTIPSGQTRGVHLLSAYFPGEGLAFVQVEVESRENEIVAAPRVLKMLDLQGKIGQGS